MQQNNSRTSHGPQLLTVTRLGNPMYGPAFAFGEIDGFYKAPRDQPNMQLIVGQTYNVAWTVKDNSPNRPYLDIVSAVPATGAPQQQQPEEALPWDEPYNQPTQADEQAAANAMYGDQPHVDPVSTGDTRDPQRKSIEKQVYVKELGAMLVGLHKGVPTEAESLLFTQPQIEWMRDEWFAGMYQLQNGRPQPEPEQEADAE
jgi:hypothetical protein